MLCLERECAGIKTRLPSTVMQMQMSVSEVIVYCMILHVALLCVMVIFHSVRKKASCVFIGARGCCRLCLLPEALESQIHALHCVVTKLLAPSLGLVHILSYEHVQR